MYENTGFKIYKKPYTNHNFIFVNILIRLILSALMSITCVYIIFSTLNIIFSFENVMLYAIATALICTFMYVNIFAALAELAIGLIAAADYAINNFDRIRTGVLAIFNEGYEVVRNSLSLPYADGFEEVKGMDCSNEVNLIVLLCTVLLTVLFSFFIGRYMSVIFGMLSVLMTVFYCYFLNNIVNIYLLLMLLAALVLVVLIRFSGSRKIKLSKYLKNSRADGSFVIQLTAITLMCCLLSYIAFGSFSFSTAPEANNYFKYSVKDVLVLKYAEYKRFEIQNTIDVGQLGFYSCIKPDFKNKFSIKTKPIDEDKLYLRNYIGSQYRYRSNCWTNNAELSNIALSNITAKALSENSDNYNEIEFIGYADDNFNDSIYLPYYTDIEASPCNYINDCKIANAAGDNYTIKAYAGEDITVNDDEYYKYALDNYTYIDKENSEVINEILNEANITADTPNIENKLREYFKNNYTYEFDSSVVPFGKDYINYFLTETKTGSFAHFASSAVLMYRAMGIPARYAGGCALDKEQILAGRFDSDGFSITDIKTANTYAWVEVYEKGFGWRYVDVSPSPSFAEILEEYDNEDMPEDYVNQNHSNILNEYFKTIENKYYNPMDIGKNIVKFIIILLIAAVFVILIYLIGRKSIKCIMWHIKYNIASHDIKAYMLMDRLRKRLKLEESSSYTDIADSSKLNEDEASRLAEISNRLVFSKNIKSNDLEELKRIIKNIK